MSENQNQLPPHLVNAILHGDCLERLGEISADSIQCCITSPPYYGLRDYGVAGQIGLERTPDCGMRNSGLLQIRPDLTPDEFDYVMRELRKCGLL